MAILFCILSWMLGVATSTVYRITADGITLHQGDKEKSILWDDLNRVEWTKTPGHMGMNLILSTRNQHRWGISFVDVLHDILFIDSLRFVYGWVSQTHL